MTKVGDKVLYVPHVDHATNKVGVAGVSPEYPWVFGQRVRYPDPQTGEQREHVKEITDTEVEKLLGIFARMNDPKTERDRTLVLIRPKAPWPATVSAVHDDGTVTLDVASNQGGVTLHYRVMHDAAKGPHTYHHEKASGEESTNAGE